MMPLSTLGIAFAIFSGAAAAAELPLALEAWQGAAYEGTVTAARDSAAGTASEVVVGTTFEWLVLPPAASKDASPSPALQEGDAPSDSADAAPRVLLVRTLTPRSRGLALPATRDVGLYRLVDGRRLAPVSPSSDTPRQALLERYVPLDWLPTFPLPEDGPSAGEAPIEGLTAQRVTVPLATDMARKGALVTVRRALPQGRTVPLDLDGAPSTLEVFEEQFVLDTSARSLLAFERHHRIVTPHGISLEKREMTTKMQRRFARTVAEVERPAVEQVVLGVSRVLEGLCKRQHPRDIYDALRSIEEDSAAFPGLHSALLDLFAQYRELLDEESRAKSRSPAQHADAPDFELESLDGKKVSFREQTRGKVVLLSFWGVGCPPCRKEAPFLTQLQEKYGDKGFTVIAVNAYDEPRDTVESFARSQGLKHPILLLGRAVGTSKFGVSAYPTVFWIGHDGKILEKAVGFRPEDYPLMEARVETFLAEAARASLRDAAPAGPPR